MAWSCRTALSRTGTRVRCQVSPRNAAQLEQRRAADIHSEYVLSICSRSADSPLKVRASLMAGVKQNCTEALAFLREQQRLQNQYSGLLERLKAGLDAAERSLEDVGPLLAATAPEASALLEQTLAGWQRVSATEV